MLKVIALVGLILNVLAWFGITLYVTIKKYDNSGEFMLISVLIFSFSMLIVIGILA